MEHTEILSQGRFKVGILEKTMEEDLLQTSFIIKILEANEW